MQSIQPAPVNFATQSNPRSALHAAIIMDGNGRWAAQRGLPRVAGHRAGVVAARRIVERAPDIGIARLTLYAFSSDNWRRPLAEVRSIFWLLRAFLRLERGRLRQAGVRIEAIGRRDRLPPLLLREIDHAESATAAGQRLHLRVAIDYSSRDAIARAALAAAADSPPPSPEQLGRRIDETLTQRIRATASPAPPDSSAGDGAVDLLIRTGGEKRLSDFLLWECAYAEFFFTDRMWPDFNAADLDAALAEFKSRERRFGAVPAIASPSAVAAIAGAQ